MEFKVLLIWISCFAFYSQPAHFANISNGIDAVINLKSRIIPKTIHDEGAAVARAIADIASIVVMGTGIEIHELGKAAASMKGAVADGLYAVGTSITKAGNTITGDYPNYYYGRRTRGRDKKFRQLKDRPSNLVSNQQSRTIPAVNADREDSYDIRGVPVPIGLPEIYDYDYQIISSPQVYAQPDGTFYITN